MERLFHAGHHDSPASGLTRHRLIGNQHENRYYTSIIRVLPFGAAPTGDRRQLKDGWYIDLGGAAAMRCVNPTLLTPSRREILCALGAGLLAPNIGRAAGFSLVAHTGGGLGAYPTKTTGAIDTTGADLLVVAYVYDYRVSPSIVDSKLNSWTGLTGPRREQCRGGEVIYAKNPIVGSGHAVTLGATGGAFYGAAYFAAFRGADHCAI